MTDTINLYEAKTHLSKLVDRAAAGEEIIIAKAGKPKAKLVPFQPPRKKRRGGQNLLGITYIAEDFDAPLPPEIQKYFEQLRAAAARCLSVVGSAVAAALAAVAGRNCRRGQRHLCQRGDDIGDRDQAGDRQASLRSTDRCCRAGARLRDFACGGRLCRACRRAAASP